MILFFKQNKRDGIVCNIHLKRYRKLIACFLTEFLGVVAKPEQLTFSTGKQLSFKQRSGKT